MFLKVKQDPDREKMFLENTERESKENHLLILFATSVCIGDCMNASVIIKDVHYMCWDI